MWAADITYLPMARGFLNLVAVMDWRSRYVLGLATVQHPWRRVDRRVPVGHGAYQRPLRFLIVIS